MIELDPVWLMTAAGFLSGMLAAGGAAMWRTMRLHRDWGERLARLKQAHDEAVAHLRDYETEAAALRAHLENTRAENDALRQKVSELENRNLALQEEKARRDVALARSDEEKAALKLRIDELKEARETLKKEFELTAAKIMEENSRHFGDLSRERIESVLAPLREQVNAFRERIETVHTQETRSLAALINEIKNLKMSNMKISEDTVNLTRALRGEAKKQGIWGEMVLERVLEASGLREGEEYEREVSLQDVEGRRLRPDVVVHLPEGRDIVIDAKTSLNAYERYAAAETEEEKARHKKAHLVAVKAHIESLADKEYTRLEGIRTPDFILMFIPVEGALALALEADPALYDKAFERRVVLVSPATLLAALRAVENVWRIDRQNRNAEKIADQAGRLYDKFVGFVEEMQKLGAQIDTLQKTYDAARQKLADGRGNLIKQAEKLKDLGAKTGKSMPETEKRL